MPRRKRVHPMLRIARAFTQEQRPDLISASMRLRQLDGPAGGPRYAVNIEGCLAKECPFGVSAEMSASGHCSVRCELRNTCRLLLTRSGEIVSATNSSEHYS